jgi:hypothetical protein
VFLLGLATRALVLALPTALLVLGCRPAAAPSSGLASLPTTASAPVATSATALDALARARADLERLLAELERIHPEPFHGVDRADWVAAKDDLAGRLPALTPEEAVVELQRLVALLSREGRDGHQFAFPVDDAEGPILPIRIHEFEEGVFITAARDDDTLVGARIDAIEGRAIADVLGAVEPLVPRDGPSTVPLFRPVLLLRTSVLRGLGIAGEGAVTARVTMPDGSTREVDLAPMSFADYRAWATDFGMFRLPPHAGLLYLDNLDEPAFRWRYLDDSDSIYVRYTQVRPVEHAELQALRERASADDVDRVIVDLRQNPGGHNHNFPAILSVLEDPAIDRPGRLLVLTDRVTFSAASNFTTSIEQSTGATFVGEPMGGGLNFWNDVRQVRLADWPIPMQVGVSTRYWQFATPDDERLTIEPDVRIPLRAADYFAGRDPVLEAALSAP